MTTGAQTGEELARIDSITWSDCAGPATGGFKVEPVNLPWRVDAKTSNSGGFTLGEIRGFEVWIYDVETEGVQCALHVRGTVDVSYDSASTQLDASEPLNTLTVKHVGGSICTSLVGEGWTVPYNANYDITAGEGNFSPITITQD